MYKVKRMDMHEPRYLVRFPSRREPNHVLFRKLHRRWHETGAFQDRHIGRKDITRTIIEEILLREFDRNPQTSLRASECILSIHRSSIMHILHEDMQHPYYLQRVQNCALTIIPNTLHSHAGICNNGSHS